PHPPIVGALDFPLVLLNGPSWSIRLDMPQRTRPAPQHQKNSRTRTTAPYELPPMFSYVTLRVLTRLCWPDFRAAVQTIHRPGRRTRSEWWGAGGGTQPIVCSRLVWTLHHL